MKLEGIHHVTAITGDARANLAFYTGVMGLRLAAKTVNQDDPSVYHLFYSDEQGHAGSDITFFEYPGAVPGRHGAGMVHTVVWRVGSPAAIDFWETRLDGLGIETRHTDGGLRFADPEGLGHELVVNTSGDDPLIADHPEIPREVALQGFEGVRAYTDDPERSRPLVERVMGAQATGDGTWELRGERRGGWIAYEPAPEEPGRQSAGSVHHVAWGTTVAEHPRWHERISGAGVQVTPIIDRHYFHSIYFREPSGVLFEIADDGPGFTVDVPLEELGGKVILPPFLEARREEIEARLTPLPDPRADWPEKVAG
jgi:glyoxalase family protein